MHACRFTRPVRGRLARVETSHSRTLRIQPTEMGVNCAEVGLIEHLGG